MMVNPSLPVRTVSDLIAYAKANRTLYGSPGVGNLLHLITELFNRKAGIKLEHVPYRGASDVLTALLQGSVHATFAHTGVDGARWWRRATSAPSASTAANRSPSCRTSRWSALGA